MKIDSNTIYYFFSTSAQVYAALLAIILTLVLFRIQRLIDKTKEDARELLERFVETSIENSDNQFVRDRIIWGPYRAAKNDFERIKLVKERVFPSGDLSRGGETGPTFFPTEANTDHLRMFWIHIYDINSLSAMTAKSREASVTTFFYGAVMICASILLVLLPGLLKESEGKIVNTCLAVGIILTHFLAGIGFFYHMYDVLKASTNIKDL